MVVRLARALRDGRYVVVRSCVVDCVAVVLAVAYQPT